MKLKKIPFNYNLLGPNNGKRAPKPVGKVEPLKLIADYLVYFGEDFINESKGSGDFYEVWLRKTYKKGDQPVGAILIPNSERDTSEPREAGE